MTIKIKIGLLMIAAIFVAMLSGCSNSDLVEDIDLEEEPIDFSSTTQKSTRAATSKPEDLASGGGFYVWGWKTPTTDPLNWSSGTTNIFEKQSVTSTSGTYVAGAETNWTYSPKKYWDRKSTYCFYAVGPVKCPGYMSLSNAEDVSKKVIQIGGTSGVTSSSSKDDAYNDCVITREPVICDGATHTGNVDFTFHHIMSKVAVKLKSGIGNKGTITVTDLKMSGWDNAAKRFIQDLSYNSSNPNYSEWSYVNNSTSYTNGTAIFLSGASVALSTNIGTPTDVDTYYIIVPQVISANTLTFTVSFTITYDDPAGENGKIVDTFTDMVGTVNTAQTWYTDCCTTYTLTISPNPIQFNVSSVDWTGSESQTINISN